MKKYGLKLSKKAVMTLNHFLISVDQTMGTTPTQDKVTLQGIQKMTAALLAEPKAKPAKPLSKKAIKSILKQVLPKEPIADKGAFLSKLQSNINTAFN